MRIHLPSTLEMALLGLLAQRPRSGYALRQLFGATPLAHYSDSPGSIYPALKNLERKRLIIGTSVMGKTKRPMKEFRLTPQGRAALTAWLKHPLDPAEVIWNLDAVKLKFAFMGGHLSIRDILAFLGAMEKAVKAYVSTLKQYRLPDAILETPTGRLGMENGVMEYETQQRWIRRAMRQLQSGVETKEATSHA